MYKIIGADGKEYGPINAEQLRQWIVEERVNAQTRVLLEGQTEWKTVAEFPELVALLGTAPAPEARHAPLASSGRRSPKNNPLAITGLVLGILSLTAGCCCYGLPFNVAGIVVSVLALMQIKSDPDAQGGRGLATAGLILSVLSIVLFGALLLLGVAMNGSEWIRKLQNR